jgi:hypothetical protein
MPNSVDIAAPTSVLPQSLSIAFAASRDWTVDSNGYAGGEYQCGIPSIYDPANQQISPWASSRKSWQLTKRLTSAQWSALIAFWKSVQGCQREFWFYDPYETVPPFSYDSTGAQISGRFAVRFNGDLTIAMSMGRPVQVNLSLLEVA